MHSDIAIGVAGHMFALPEDQSIDIEEQNPMFHDVEMHSYPVELPFDNNRAVFGNIDDVNSSLRAVDVEGQTARIFVSGLPFRTSILHVQEDVVLNDSISVNFDSRTKTFKDMIQDMKCREVPVDDNIKIGQKIGDINLNFTYQVMCRMAVFGEFDHGESTSYGTWIEELEGRTGSDSRIFTPPALGFSKPGVCSVLSGSTKDYSQPDITVKEPDYIEKYINVSQPYPTAKYCNTRVCYQHHAFDEEKGTSDDIVDPTKDDQRNNNGYGPYWVLPADRPASGICFYVAYFLERLFKHLGVAYDMTALTSIEDFNYMAFINTDCKYSERLSTGQGAGALGSIDAINKWLNDRGCGGQVAFEEKEAWEGIEVSSFTDKDGNTYKKGDHYYEEGLRRDINNLKQYVEVEQMNILADVHDMYATSDNFPDATVTEVIESLENAFGCRFAYDHEINKVTVILLRDMFRQRDSLGNAKTPIKLNGIVTSIRPMTEKITGVRVLYGAESDSQEQRENVRTGKRDYDTDFDYIDYPEDRTYIKPYSEVMEKIEATDMSVYVDPNTGNAIRIKVDKDATTAKEMKPVAFEVGAFKGVEEGDCSKDNDDYIKEISIGFTPLVVNDVNYRYRGNGQAYQPLLVPFVDEDMEREFVEQKIQNPFSIDGVYVYLSYKLQLLESYDPGSTDDGNSPLATHDWGLTLGILRTGNGGEGVENYDPDYDGFGNWRWRDIADNYCMSSDTMDQLGTWLGKTSQANTFSLKIRAWKPFLYYIDAQGKMHITPYDRELEGKSVSQGSQYTWLLPCENDEREQGKITKRIRSRGLADVFLAEYIRFLLDRHKYKVKADIEVAQLADIPKHWCDRYEIDGKIGYIDKLHYSIDAQTGVGEVEMDFYAI